MLFAIDDSEIQIEDSPHTIMAALGVQHLAHIDLALNQLKVEFGLMPTDEVKWEWDKTHATKARGALSQGLMVFCAPRGVD